MDTTFDYFHKQLTFRPDKGSRWEESPREFFIPFQRYYERYENSFRNYFEYNVFIYRTSERFRNWKEDEEKWKKKKRKWNVFEERARSRGKGSFNDDAASGVTRLSSHSRNSRGWAWSRVQIFRDKNVGKRKEWQQVGTCCLRLGCITTLLCTFLPREQSASRNRKHVLSICSGRKKEPALLSRLLHPVGTMSTTLRNTCFSSTGVTLATLARYSTLNTFYTLPRLRFSTGRKDLIRNMCFFFPLIIPGTFSLGIRNRHDITEEEQRRWLRLENLTTLCS